MARKIIVKPAAGETAPVAKGTPRNGVRLTIDVPVGLDIRLGALAKSQRERKGTFIVRLLDQGARKYALDEVLRSAFPEIPSEDVAAA